MSLFKIKTIWNATFPQEEFDQKHLAFGLVYKVPTLVVGSYKGNLRVYSFNPNTKYVNKCFCLSFEKQFDEPIIDIKFVTHPDESMKENTLGVLLFKKFVYLTLLQNKQKPSIYSSRLLNVQVQPSFAIIPSPLSLATLNSTIQSLNPKQLHQIKQSDSIYSFIVDQENMYYMDGEDLVKTRGDIEQWRIVVGRVRRLFLVREVVVVIGEMHLWEVMEGKIVKCKHLEEEVSTACIAHKPNGEFNIIVCNFLTQMLVYSQNYALLWAVKLDYVPISIIVSDSMYLKGAIIMLTDQGTVQVTCLGTEIQERELRVLDEQVSMELVDKQTAYYLQKLREMKMNGQQLLANQQQSSKSSNGNAATYLTIKPTFSQPQLTKQFVEDSNQYFRSQQTNELLKCVLNVDLISQSTQLTNCIVSLHKPSNIYCLKDQIQMQTVRGRESVKFDCFISKEKFPYERQVKVNVRFEKGKSTHFLTQSIAIPITFQCQVHSYESMDSAESKITFKCSDVPLPPFNSLFGDIMQRGCGQQKKAITFRLANGVKSSIIYNKNLTKVKIESEVYSGLCFIFIEFINRIQGFLRRQKHLIKPIQVEVPLKQLQQQIRDYFSYRVDLKKQYSELQQRIEEFKKGEKKLLLKMKEKNSQLSHLYTLLEYTHNNILQSAQKYEQLLEDTNIVNHNFEVSLKLVMQLVYKRSAATQKAIDLAESIVRFDALSENVQDEEGWGERLTKSTAYYLNKKYQATLQNLQKLVTWVITKVNNGDWNQ